MVKCPICDNLIKENSNSCDCGFRFFEVKKQGLLSKIFSSKSKDATLLEDERILKVYAFKRTYLKLLKQDDYISKSAYLPILSEQEENILFLNNLKKNNLLENYCKDKKIAIENIENYFKLYNDLPDLIKSKNEKYINDHLISDKKYLDNILHEVDPKIMLDEEQRRVVLSDEDNSLIIAGAGSGKTTTIAAKVKYLVDKKQINPRELLIISFTNKAVNELKMRINQGLKIDCPIATFHKTGYALIRKQKTQLHTSIVSEGEMYNTFSRYLSETISNNPELLTKLINFFGYYLNYPIDFYPNISNEQYHLLNERRDYTSLKSNVGEFNQTIISKRTKERKTINNELLRSSEEVKIANFLYLHNIDYQYEKPYKHRIPQASKEYTPDFTLTQDGRTLYLEHFGISEDGCNDRYSPEELEKYKISMKYKINHHQIFGTRLISTFSRYNDGRDLVDHLQEELINNGLILRRKSDDEVFEKIKQHDKDKYITKLVNLLVRFIKNFKTLAYTEKDFNELRSKTKNVRNHLFFDIAEQVYLHYQGLLKEHNKIDFSDMINESADILEKVKEMKEQIAFKYIFIDEYQDISLQRFNLAQKLREITNAKLIAVGDDWQSIFAYAGSDITLFTEFEKHLGYADELKISYTYRNSQELIDIAGNFIQQNSKQIKKTLKSPLRIKNPIVLLSYDDIKIKRNNGPVETIKEKKAKLLEAAIEMIIKEAGMDKSILLIGRYNFDLMNICDSNLFYEYNRKVICKKYPRIKISFLTAHASKGLGYDYTIILNADHGTYGFPAQISDDPVLKFVVREDRSYEFSEERRLFYVALTRTKNKVFILVPKNNPSKFIIELIDDYQDKGLEIIGRIASNVRDLNQSKKLCPICGYPLFLRTNGTLGMRLYICSNEPELCDFMSNDLGAVGDIHLCDQCNGYMIVKRNLAKKSYLFGCTNYRHDGKGCNNTKPIKN